MDIQPLDLIIHAANFIIMMLALWLILWKPVSKYIKGRADRVKADREAAENEVKEAKMLRSEAEMKLQSVSRDAETLRREVNARAESEAAALIGKATRHAEAIVAKAKQDAEAIKAKAMISEREETVALATALAQKIIGREVKVEDNRALADEFFASLENGGTEKTKK